MENENKLDQVNETPENAKTDAPDQNAKPTGWKRVVKEVREWVVSLAVAIVAVILIKEFIFLPIRVDGSSMYPTLENGERLAVTVFDVKIADKVQRGDVVICNYPGRTNKDPLVHLITMDTNFVKRVVGMPGDTVSRERGVTFVNGKALDPRHFNPYYSAKLVEVQETTDESGNRVKKYTIDLNGEKREVIGQQIHAYNLDYEYVLGEDEYFVVGDNRYNSHDCRAWNGPDVELNLVNDASGDVGPITHDMIVGRAKYAFWPLDSMRKVEIDTEYIDPKDR